MNDAALDHIEFDLPILPCRIGVLPGENERTQPVRVSVRVGLDLSEPATKGQLQGGVDYARLHAATRDRVLAQRWTLLEALAGAILDDLLVHDRVEHALVTVEKCRPPLGIGAGPVRVELNRQRGDGRS